MILRVKNRSTYVDLFFALFYKYKKKKVQSYMRKIIEKIVAFLYNELAHERESDLIESEGTINFLF